VHACHVTTLPPMQVRPAQCTAPRGEWVTVPFTAVQDYFWC
jgi:hypothetical protein